MTPIGQQPSSQISQLGGPVDTAATVSNMTHFHATIFYLIFINDNVYIFSFPCYHLLPNFYK